MTNTRAVSRRKFMEGTMASAASLGLLGTMSANADEAGMKRKIKVGLVGGGGRGRMIADFMLKHGGYEIHAVADYFPAVTTQLQKRYQVDPSRCFSGLSGYKKAIESGVEALVIMDVPAFYPEQAAAAVDAGCHVYQAKPFAVDVPGCLRQQATAKKATEKNLCVLVDYQLPLDAGNMEVAKRMQEGGVAGLSYILSGGRSACWPDPVKGATIENLLRQGWLSHVNLGGDNIVSYDIHIIDGIMWMMGKPPVSASGLSRATRSNAHGDRTDCGSVTYQFGDGMIWAHLTQAHQNNAKIHNLGADLMGHKATATINYWGKALVHGGSKQYNGKVSGTLYNDGAMQNVHDFYRCITEADFTNKTAHRAFDGTLTAILGREAMARQTVLTMDELLKENRKLEVDLSGLKV